MSILKIKNCLAVVVLLGATSGYSMEAVPPSIELEEHSLGYKPSLHRIPVVRIDDCSHRHRHGSVSSDSSSDSDSSDDEGGSFVKIVNKNKHGRAIAAKSQTLNLLKMAAESSEGMSEAERLVRQSHLYIARAVQCQAESLKAFARGASLRLSSEVFVDDSRKFFRETGSACGLAREERETADVLRSMAATDLRMAGTDASLAVAEEMTALGLERDAAALMRTASVSSSDDEAATKPHVVSKPKHRKKKR